MCSADRLIKRLVAECTHFISPEEMPNNEKRPHNETKKIFKKKPKDRRLIFRNRATYYDPQQ
jgi:hypothetical protein